MGIKRYHDRLLSQISNDLSATASRFHRVDLERIGRKAEAAGRFQAMLADLKRRLERRAVVRTQPRIAMARFEAPSQAA